MGDETLNKVRDILEQNNLNYEDENPQAYFTDDFGNEFIGMVISSIKHF